MSAYSVFEWEPCFYVFENFTFNTTNLKNTQLYTTGKETFQVLAITGNSEFIFTIPQRLSDFEILIEHYQSKTWSQKKKCRWFLTFLYIKSSL